MEFGVENDRKRLAVLASARTRDCSEAVLVPNFTAGRGEFAPVFSACSSQTGRFASDQPKKPDLRIPSRQNDLHL
jgi:hypothetical protein